MPARRKEVVVNADLRNTEYLRPKVGLGCSPSRKNLPPAARTTIFNPNPYLQIEAVRKGIQRKMTAYYAYHAELLNTEKIMADIHFIGSEHVQPLPE
ncbi:hypothetical protein ACFQY3_09305 [Paenibacillus farraposensis]|uniref:hypothetical protein n=1 Tax=Paenibacillus farraposensis TaxID=2807095 RepID=UPI001E5AFC3B|nr:hypothetical protein [Paenibacillus farraposensis]